MQPTANRRAEISSPYRWLSSLTEAEHFLPPSVNLVELYREAHVQADHEVAQVQREMHDQLFAAPQAVPKSCPVVRHTPMKKTLPVGQLLCYATQRWPLDWPPALKRAACRDGCAIQRSSPPSRGVIWAGSRVRSASSRDSCGSRATLGPSWVGFSLPR